MILRGLKFLRAPVDHSGLDQRHDSVGDQFAVHSQIFAVHQKRKHSVWNSADPGLYDSAVFDQPGHISGDRDIEVRDFRLLQSSQSGRDDSTIASILLTWMKLSP